MEKVLTKIPAHADKMQRRIDKQRASIEKEVAKIIKENVRRKMMMKKLAKNAAVLGRKRVQEKLRKEKQLASHKKKVDKVIKETVKIANKKYKKSIRIVSDDAIKTGNRMTIVVKKSREQ
jgi:regulator of replication initiation timing